MARILFTVPRFHTNLWFATRALIRNGHVVELFANGSSAGEDHSLLVPKVLGLKPSRREVRSATMAFAPDILLIRNSWALSRRAARVARQLGKPALLYNQRPATARDGLRRRAKLIWSGLPLQRITPVRGMDPAAEPAPGVHYLPWPVGRLPVRESLARDPDRLEVLLVGKFGSARKNQDRLLAAIEASGLHRKIAVTLVGSTPAPDDPHYRRLSDYARKPWIRMVRDVPFLRMPDYYAAHDVCILPSFGEPLGTSPIEAMAYGAVPVISRQCGTAGYITHGQDGLLFDPSDMTEAVSALADLADNRDRLEHLRIGAQHTFESDLSEAVFIKRFNQLLSDFGMDPGP